MKIWCSHLGLIVANLFYTMNRFNVECSYRKSPVDAANEQQSGRKCVCDRERESGLDTNLLSTY